MSWKDCEHCVAGTCGYAIANRKARSAHKGHRFYKAPLPRSQVVTREMSMRKPVVNLGTNSDGAALECDLALRWTNLWEFLSSYKYGDGEKRKPGTVLLIFEDGQWKGMLSCKDTQRIAFLTAATWEQLMERLDTACQTGEADWRKSKPWKKG